MIKFVRHSLLHNPAVLQVACSKCRQLLGSGLSSETTVSCARFYSEKQSAKRLQINVQKYQGRGGSRSQLNDPIRPVADKLLHSLMKRHGQKFAALDTRNRSTSVSPPTSSAEDLIHAIYKVPKVSSGEMNQMENIERRLMKQLYRMTLEEALQACHGFYLHDHKLYAFLSQMLSIMDERFDDLCPSAGEITRLMFYVFIHGNAPTMLLNKVEKYMLENVDEFDISDLGVVCAGFFRANSRLSSQDLLDIVAKKLLKDLNVLEPFLLLDFVKTFRHASYIKVSFYEQLADCLIESKFISSYRGLNPVMHIAFTYASIPVQHTGLFECLLSQVEQLLTKQKYIRTKDISKFVWACGTLQFRPDNFERRYSQLVERFEANSKDSRDFPESIAELLMGLAYLGIFPQHLLHRCLSSDVATKLLESGADREKTFQLLLLNESVKIECPDYKGNLVSKSQMEALLRHPSVSHDLDTELQTRVGLLAALSCLQRCLGEKKVRCRRPFIHFKSSVIELWHSSKLGFVDVSPSSSSQQTFSSTQGTDTFTQRAVTESLYSALTNKSEKTSQVSLPSAHTRLAIVVTSSNQFALNDHMQPLGHLHTMIRQLDKEGYTVVKIFPKEALRLELSSHEERSHHLSAVLSSALQTTISLS